jgi:hypothetical protein
MKDRTGKCSVEVHAAGVTRCNILLTVAAGNEPGGRGNKFCVKKTTVRSSVYGAFPWLYSVSQA